MRKVKFLLFVFFALFLSNYVVAYTIERDPSTPLADYVSMAEWNVDGDFEDWTTFQLIDIAVTSGNFLGTTTNNDPNISLNIDGLPPTDLRVGHATTTNSIIEFRMQFATNTQNSRIEFFPTIAGSGPGVLAPFLITDLPTDGIFHVYRISLNSTDTNHQGAFTGIRFDMLAD